MKLVCRLLPLLVIVSLPLFGCALSQGNKRSHDGLLLSDIEKHLKPDFSAEECRRIFGMPARDMGSGLFIYEYAVKEGGSVSLTFSTGLVSATYFPIGAEPRRLFLKQEAGK